MCTTISRRQAKYVIHGFDKLPFPNELDYFVDRNFFSKHDKSTKANSSSNRLYITLLDAHQLSKSIDPLLRTC